jgi:putative salt-induced outer membrane protein YdiY
LKARISFCGDSLWRCERTRHRARSVRLIAVCLFALVGHTLHADEALLMGGNRLTGTVRNLARGELEFAIDGVGTASIEWSNVERLSSERRMDVELASGERLEGTIASPVPGRLEVTNGAGSREFQMTDIVRIHPIETGFLERASGSVDFGIAALGAHDEKDFTLNLEGEHRTVNYLTEASMSLLVRELDGEKAQDRKDIALAGRRFLSNRWFVIGQLGWEDNQELTLDSRALLGVGAGRVLVQSNRMVLSLYGGVDYAVERYEGIETDRSPEAMGALEFDWFEVGDDTTASTRLAVFRNLDRNRTLVQLDATLHRDFFDNFFWSVTVYEILDGDPPPGAEDNDYGVTVGIGRNF